jgi:hypothetical protein
VLNVDALWSEVIHNKIDTEDPQWHERLIVSSQAQLCKFSLILFAKYLYRFSSLVLPIHQRVDVSQEKSREDANKWVFVGVI